jgi:ligand-binding sensor domain-containing protein
VDAVLATHDGTVWIGGADALDDLRDDKLSAIPGFLGKQVTSLMEDDKHRLWVGIDDTLTIYENGGFRQIKKQDGTPVGMIVDMVEDRDKNIWLDTAGTSSGLLIRIHNDKVQEQLPAPHGHVAADSGWQPLGRHEAWEPGSFSRRPCRSN